MAGFKIPKIPIPDALKITGVGETAGGLAIRIANARLFPASSGRMRGGMAVDDIITENAANPRRYAGPPWSGPKGVPPWKQPKATDPRAGVKARALQEEAIAKAQLKIKKKKETSAAIAKRRAINLNKNK